MEKKMSKAEGETRTCLKCGHKIVARRARGGGAGVNATVVGGGLAGSEAAWALAERGVRVTLYEMRPVVPTPAHSTDRLAELVCSNSFKSIDLTNAHGLLKAELRALGSLLLPCADEARVPGGTALAVDREVFSQAVHERVTGASRTSPSCARKWPSCRRPGVVATGPLTSRPPRRGDRARLGSAALAFYDAIAPVVSSTTRSTTSRLYALSRYGKGDGDDYLNAPMDARGLRGVPRRARSRPTSTTGTSSTRCPTSRAACRSRRWRGAGRETLRFGPMKPVGLPDPRTGREPHAVVQLRREDRAGQMWNLVGFQTRLRIPEQQRVFRMIPGLERAEFLRFGSIHRNSYLNSPATPRARAHRAGRRPALLRRPAHRRRGLHRVARHRAPGGHQPGAPARGHAGRRPAADHDAGRALPLPARGGSEALPADERELRAARSAAGEGQEGPEEGAAGRAGAGGLRVVPGASSR